MYILMYILRNKLNKFSVLAFICLQFFNPASSEPLSSQTVRSAVQTWVRHITANAKPDAVIESIEPLIENGETIGYVSHIKGGGYCIGAADDLLLPCYLYSPDGTYNHENPSLQYIQKEIAGRLTFSKNAKLKNIPSIMKYDRVLRDRASYWQDLSLGQAPKPSGKTKVLVNEPDFLELPVTSEWHQGSPYNDLCPLLTAPDDRAVVGCVATAMAQMMYYWQWPNNGVGSGSTTYNFRWRPNWDAEPLTSDPAIPARPHWTGRLRWNATGGGRLEMNGNWDGSLYRSARSISANAGYQSALDTLWNSLTHSSQVLNANFSAANYNWGVMQDRHRDPVDNGDQEAAELSRHAGIAVGMGYGLLASSAYSQDIEHALEDHFRFDHDAEFRVRDAETVEHLTKEVQWLRPVFLGGQDPIDGGGHEWFVYGYNMATDPNRQFLMNMGWGPGNSAVWFTIDTVDFNSGQDIVRRIAPDTGVAFVGADTSGDGTPAEPYENIEEAISDSDAGSTLIFRAGSVNGFSTDTLVIDRPFVLIGLNARIE